MDETWNHPAAVAYIIWILDNTRTICFEHSLIQGHAIWHILGAVAVLFLHKYYVSEKISSSRTPLVEYEGIETNRNHDKSTA